MWAAIEMLQMLIIFALMEFDTIPILVLDVEVVQLHIFVLNAIAHEGRDIIGALCDEGLTPVDLDVAPASER